MPMKFAEPRRVLTLLAGALLCALVSNALAPAQRRLAWTGWAPAPIQKLSAPAPIQKLSAPAPIQKLPAPAPIQKLPAPTPTLKLPAAAPTKEALPAPYPQPAPPLPPRQGPPRQAPAAAGTRFAPAPDATTREISSEEAWAAFQLKVPFLDARRSEDFAAGHVLGAHSVPVWEADLETRITRFEAAVHPAPAGALVLYCAGGDCEDSQLLAHKLETLGYRNLLLYRDGFPDWVAKARPAAPGARP